MLQKDFESEQFITNDFGDKYLHSVNHNTLNNSGAKQLHKERFKSCYETKDTLYIVIGSDSGTLLPFLNAVKTASGTQFILIEPAEVYTKITKEYNNLELSPSLHFITPDELEATFSEVKINRYLYAGSLTLIRSLAAEYGFLPAYHELLFSTQTLCKQVEFQVNVQLQGKPFIEAQLKNLTENYRSSLCLKDLFPGKTAVLLAGGPSLDELIPWIKEKKDTLVTLAVSRICRRLIEVDLTPDIIFTIDPHDLSFDISKEIFHFSRHSLLINMFHASPLIVGQWQGRSVYLKNRFPWLSEKNLSSLPSSGPTVANTALSVATKMGFAQILLAGVDLCFSRDGYTHAAGSNEHKTGPQLTHSTTLVETNGGWYAETPSDFVAGIHILSQQAKEAQDAGVIFINPAQGAAKVDHVLHTPLEQIEPAPMDQAIEDILQTAAPPRTKEEYVQDIKALQEEIVCAKGKIIQIRKLAQEALRCNEGLFGRKGRKQNFKHKIRMDKIEKKLNTTYNAYTYFLKNYGATELLKIARLSSHEDWTDEEIEESARKYYSEYIKIADKALELIDDCKKRINSRKEELKNTPDFNVLFDQWERDNQPGRLYLWLSRHDQTIASLPLAMQAKARKIEEQCRHQNDPEQASAHLKRCIHFADLTGVPGKIRLYFTQGDKQSLINIKKALTKHPSPAANTYRDFCSGHIFELEEDWSKAINAYRSIVESGSETLREDTLLRIAFISLKNNDIDNSKTALESLSQLSAVYFTHYADFLRLTGKNREALELYLSAIEKFPKNISLMLKVGLYYRELNIEEGAAAMFQHVLMLDPDNSAARQYLKGCN